MTNIYNSVNFCREPFLGILLTKQQQQQQKAKQKPRRM